MGYREKVEVVNIQGEVRSWVRAKTVVCDNPYKKRPSMTFFEEEVKVDPDGKESLRGRSNIKVDYDPSVVLPLLNPQTEIGFTQEEKDQICKMIQSGNISHSLALGMIYSIYIYSAIKRDEKGKSE